MKPRISDPATPQLRARYSNSRHAFPQIGAISPRLAAECGLLSLALLANACFGPPPKGATHGAGGADENALVSCGPTGVIDDAEDNNNQISPAGDRGGYWYTFVDKEGSTVSPTAGDQGGTFTMVDGGANNSGHAANVKGKLGTADVVYAAMAFNFMDPKGAYDASKFAGITFFAKRGANSTGKVRVKVPDTKTDPAGGVCSECFNDFGFELDLTPEWQRYVIPFDKMRQMEGWGAPHPSHIDASKIYGVQFQVNAKGADYDIFVDDIAFVCR